MNRPRKFSVLVTRLVKGATSSLAFRTYTAFVLLQLSSAQAFTEAPPFARHFGVSGVFAHILGDLSLRVVTLCPRHMETLAVF